MSVQVEQDCLILLCQSAKPIRGYLFQHNLQECFYKYSFPSECYLLLWDNPYNYFLRVQLSLFGLWYIRNLHLLYPRLFIRGFSDFHQSVGLYLHLRLYSGQVFGTRVNIIGFHPQLLVSEPSKLLLLDSFGLAADQHMCEFLF